MIYDLAVRNLRYSNYSLNMCLLTEVVILAIRSKVIVYNCRSRAGSHFYGTEYEIWADFGPVGNTEKKDGGADYEQLLRAVFSCFQGQKKSYNCFKKYPSVRTKKLHKMLFIKKFLNFF